MSLNAASAFGGGDNADGMASARVCLRGGEARRQPPGLKTRQSSAAASLAVSIAAVFADARNQMPSIIRMVRVVVVREVKPRAAVW